MQQNTTKLLVSLPVGINNILDYPILRYKQSEKENKEEIKNCREIVDNPLIHRQIQKKKKKDSPYQTSKSITS